MYNTIIIWNNIIHKFNTYESEINVNRISHTMRGSKVAYTHWIFMNNEIIERISWLINELAHQHQVKIRG